MVTLLLMGYATISAETFYWQLHLPHRGCPSMLLQQPTGLPNTYITGSHIALLFFFTPQQQPSNTTRLKVKLQDAVQQQ